MRGRREKPIEAERQITNSCRPPAVRPCDGIGNVAAFLPCCSAIRIVPAVDESGEMAVTNSRTCGRIHSVRRTAAPGDPGSLIYALLHAGNPEIIIVALQGFLRVVVRLLLFSFLISIRALWTSADLLLPVSPSSLCGTVFRTKRLWENRDVLSIDETSVKISAKSRRRFYAAWKPNTAQYIHSNKPL